MKNKGIQDKTNLKPGRKQGNNGSTPRSQSQKSSGTFDLSQSLMLASFKNHPGECLCKDCLCGRHMCNLEQSPPSMSLASTYQMHYPPKAAPQYRQAARPASARVPSTPLLSGESTYLNDFGLRNGDPLERPKPEDQLKCKPGFGELTSYRQEYPGHKGKNQYVPVNPELFRGGLEFSGTSNYSKEFNRRRGHSAENAKPADQFRMNGSWLGDSSYRGQFQNPKAHVSKDRKAVLAQSPSLSRSKVSSVGSQKNASSHFKTTYGSDFRGSKRSVCPAALRAIELESSLDKSSFKENTVFKGFDSHYSSLAKHGNQF